MSFANKECGKYMASFVIEILCLVCWVWSNHIVWEGVTQIDKDSYSEAWVIVHKMQGGRYDVLFPPVYRAMPKLVRLLPKEADDEPEFLFYGDFDHR